MNRNRIPGAIEGVHYFRHNGRVFPIVRGGDGPLTVTDLTDQRAAALDEIDDIINTCREASRSMTDEERTRHDELVNTVEGAPNGEGIRSGGLDEAIRSATLDADDQRRFEGAEARRARYSTVSVNTAETTATATRSLDELLWATDETVAAGRFGKAGQFQQHSTARNAVEQIAVRSQNDDLVLAPRIGDFAPQHRQAVRSFQQTVANMALFGMMIDNSAKSSAQGFEVARSHKAMKGRWQQICRALDVDTSAEGTEWVPTGIGASLHEKVRASGKVAPLFPRIDLPTNPWKWPIEGADATAYRVAEPTSDTAVKVTASTPGTAAATFDAEIFGARTLWSRSLDADSAIAILPFSTMKLVQAFVDAEERAIINGDTDGTHQDSDTLAVGATDAASAWDGLRKKALANTVATATSCTALNLGIVRKAMGKWGVNPAELAFIIGVSNLHSLLADTNLLTVDKMGPNAVILNGQIGSVFGVPVIVSEHVREDLNASGVYDGITTTKTSMLCVNRNEWAIGQRMALDVQVDDSIYRESFQRVAVAFMREDFQSLAGAATNEDTAIAYNVTP